jgi:hypothetical protein
MILSADNNVLSADNMVLLADNTMLSPDNAMLSDNMLSFIIFFFKIFHFRFTIQEKESM